MQMSNLQRAAEIAASLPILKKAREDISQMPDCVSINGVAMPRELSYRVAQALNLEINEMEREIVLL